MKKSMILNIARAELKMIFTTPVAWIMMTVFTVLCALFFSDVLNMYAEAQAAGSHLSFVTAGIFSSDNGLFPTVQFYLFLFIPLVSMGMISRDLSTGSVKLLYSSPVTDTQIVLGKFTAMLGYGLAMLGIVLVFVLYGAWAIVNADIPLLLTGLLGFFLLISAYSAIGVFMSSLTSYQVVAALATFAAFTVLGMMGKLAQGVMWLRDITWWLSISGRCETFIAGLICSEDLIYFITVTALFLALTIMRISNRRRSRGAGARLAGYGAAVAVTVAIAFLSSRPVLMWFHDVTETEMNTITVPSREIMKRVEGKVVMTSYANILDEDGFYLGIPSRFNNDKDYFKQYLRFKPDIKLKYEYYWADAGSASVRRRFPDMTDEQRAETLADVYELNFDKFLNPEEIAAKIDLSGEGYRLVREIRLADGRSTFLRIYDDGKRMPEEKEITAAFKRLIDGSIPVGFLSGHGERNIVRSGDRDYFIFANARTFRHSLLNNGFDAEEVFIGEDGRIPDHIEILMIADPRQEFSEHEIAEIARYVDSGRNLILAAEPGYQDCANAVASLVGGKYKPGRIAVPQGEDETQQNLILSTVTRSAVQQFPTLASARSHDYRVTMPDAVHVTVSEDAGYEILPVLTSVPEAWSELQTTDFVNTVAYADSLSGDKIGRKATAVCLTREKEGRTQKILLLGDADCFSNSELTRQRYAVNSGNFSFLYEMFHWLSDGQYPVDTPRRGGSDRSLRLGIEHLSLIKWTFAGILPLLMLLATVLISIRRKSR